MNQPTEKTMNAYDQPVKIILLGLVIVFFAVLLSSCDDAPTTPDFTTSENAEVVILPKRSAQATDIEKLCRSSLKKAERECPSDPNDPNYDPNVQPLCAITGYPNGRLACECSCEPFFFVTGE